MATSASHLPDEVVRLLSTAAEHPLAIIRREDSECATVLTGTVGTAETLAQIPLEGENVLALIPYAQIRERGWAAVPGPEPLLYLRAQHRWEVPVDALLEVLPRELPAVEDIGFDVSDEQYAQQVASVIEEEIGRGEGANFVLRRDYHARTDAAPAVAVLSWLARLLRDEAGSYWTFAWIGGGVACAGASPERHVSVTAGNVLMNPISGTFRHQGSAPTVDDLLRFLADRKESEELVMVVDEELKMMSAVCPEGGVMRGPFLKPMTKVTHTEYLLEGHSDLDPREVLRLTMFAPTVIGSPMENACRIIARREGTSRGYYSGVLALFEAGDGDYSLDAPILLRTAFIDPDGEITVSAGATLVRHSDPVSEAEETRAKASGMLAALGLGEGTLRGGRVPPTAPMKDLPQVRAALADRNRDLAPFWRDKQAARGDLEGCALLVDCGDDFNQMLAHQLRHLGLETSIVRWDQVTGEEEVDLMVFGPGPGDPTDDLDPRVRRLRELISARVSRQLPTVAVCFSHQVLSSLAGLPIELLPDTRQGLPLRVKILGEESLVGFYNTFAAVAPDGSLTPDLGLRVEADPDTDVVSALVGPQVASVQGHLESVLSFDGYSALKRVVSHAFG